MSLFLGLVFLMASIVLAAPSTPQVGNIRVNAVQRDTPFSPLLSLLNGGTHTVEIRDVPTPPPLVLPDGGTHTLQTQDAPTDPPLFIREDGATMARRALHKPIRKPKSIKRPRSPVRRPLSFITGGEHTLVPVDKGRGIRKREDATPTIPPLTLTTVYASPGGPAITTYVASTSCVSAAPTARPLLNNTEAPCHTALIPQITPVCATSLVPLAAPPIAITDCDQYATYSSQYGYTLVPTNKITAAGNMPHYVQAVQTLTTYYAAPWSKVVPGTTPASGIEVVCLGEDCQTQAFGAAASATSPAMPTGSDGAEEEVTTTVRTTRTSTFTTIGGAATGT